MFPIEGDKSYLAIFPYTCFNVFYYSDRVWKRAYPRILKRSGMTSLLSYMLEKLQKFNWNIC